MANGRRGRVPAAALRAPVGRQLRPVVAEGKEARAGARAEGWPAGRARGAWRRRQRRDGAARARKGADGAASCLRRCGGSGTG